MIFASDLDRTLIYTKKLIKEEDNDIVLVERYLGKELSFMKKNVIEKLKKVREKALFIPVTTRTIEQYNRIFIMNDTIKPTYAIVSNGGNILVNGKVDSEWRNIIKKAVDRITNRKFVEKKFLNSFKDTSWIDKMVLRDGLFFSVHFKDKELIDKEEFNSFKSWAEVNKWNVSLQGRKLYIVPSPVNKWDALLYVKKKEKKMKIVSAGDSFLDYPILINADYSICASHGELKKMLEDKTLKQDHISLTEGRGINASEEILESVEKLV
ncbi:HAD family hydrolase [Clostridium ganghwense]|uniref:Sucrose phosphatase-like domain-containing protein n=1 Tax=Clostridium ganghwense TaxID=312089 RepID=A0ABT4CQ02_9CLOT|nr:HAD family hydrolase [Clostridium ganghwense]MCY6370079.1 hypothetical protein [Clostridium ganghwense]